MAATILVADDDRVTVRLISARLKTEGYEVVAAYDAMQVGMLAQRSPPAATILDINMPGGTGLGALRRLRASSKTGSVPIIAISAADDPSLPEETKKLGADAFLPKPISFERLFQLLRDLVS